MVLDQGSCRAKADWVDNSTGLCIPGMELGVRDTEQIPLPLRPSPKALVTKCYPTRRGRRAPSGVEFVGC